MKKIGFIGDEEKDSIRDHGANEAPDECKEKVRGITKKINDEAVRVKGLASKNVGEDSGAGYDSAEGEILHYQDEYYEQPGGTDDAS